MPDNTISAPTTTSPPPALLKASLNSKVKLLVRHLSMNDKWKDYNEEMEAFVQKFPKVELHVHLDGAFDPDVLWEYLQTHQPESLQCLPVSTELPWEADDSPQKFLAVQALVQSCRSSQDYHKLCTCRGYRSLKQMLTCFEIFLPTVRCNLKLLEQMAYDFCERQWQQHVIYTEVRYSPFLLAEGYNDVKKNKDDNDNSISGEDVYRSITQGLRRGCQAFGITINQILCCITWRPDWAHSTVDLVQKYRTDFPCATVGIDIASGEEHFDQQMWPNLYRPHYDAFRRAQALGIPITMHAGEVPLQQQGVENIRRAVHEYGASRIGHGYRVATHPEVMEEMKRLNIHFEICPTSSVETGGWMYDDEEEEQRQEDSRFTSFSESSCDSGGGDDDNNNNINNKETPPPTNRNWKRHPCRTMQSHGLSISLNSDDPAVFHTSLAWQYRTALGKMKMSRYELYQTNLQAMDAAFLPQDQKEQYRAQIIKFCQSMRVIDDQCRPYSTSDDDRENVAERSASLRHYRRSWSENFKDRVYFQTTTTTITTTRAAMAAAAFQNEAEQRIYL